MRLLSSLALVLALAACKVATLRPLDTRGSTASNARSFDAPAYVESIWATRVLPTFERDATDCRRLLSDLEADPEGTLRRLGRGPRGRTYLMVKGEGTVVAVDQRSRTGLLGIDVPPEDGQADVWLQIGPVLQDMALRDAVGLSFDQFANQIDYADAGNALNQRVLDSVVKGRDLEHAKGASFSFCGALAVGERLVVTPVRLSRRAG